MNLLNKKWIKYKNNNVKIHKENGRLIIENNSNRHGFVCCTHIFKKQDDYDVKLNFEGKVLNGEAALLTILNRKREILAEGTLNSTTYITNQVFKYYIIAIKIFPNTKMEVSNVELENVQKVEDIVFKDFNSDVLVITPSYPSEEHKYMAGFVHSRVSEYKKNNINVDIAVVYKDYNGITKYTFEGINAVRMDYSNLRSLLQRKKYKKILIHFFTEKYFNVLEGCNLDDTEIFVWVHGPETLYWDSPHFTTKYYEPLDKIPEEEEKEYLHNDTIIKKMNEKPNVKWIFVSQWIKDRSEELLKIKFNNYAVIPNIIDTKLFKYEKKNEEKMLNVFVLRRYDNINKYAVDIVVKTILELSKRKCFDKLNFNIYGTGSYYDELLDPIKKFDNVHFYKSFFTHKEIAEIHSHNGIALFPTRYDAQGVSMCEAGSSGLLVISSENDAIKEFIPSKDGNIIETENYVKYADFIEKIIKDKKLFNKITKETSEKIIEKCSYEATVKKEIELIKKEYVVKENKKKLPEMDKNPILSIIIPSYNVSQYIYKTLKTLLVGNDNSKYLEILVVNDGSKDNTKEEVNRFINDYCSKKGSIVRLVDKENGGHGSTINVGMKEAKGKYFRVIDGDDWVNTSDFSKLIEILKKEKSDIVVTNYSEDRMDSKDSRLIQKRLYDFMTPGHVYKFDDLCGDDGFETWGPILATANIKTAKIKEANFQLSEKCFYVDMEFNTFYLPVIETISYYDLDIYRYFIGRVNQSISLKSFVRNINQHEHVIDNILTFISSHEISEAKRKYIYKNIVDPMIIAHYSLLTDTIRDRKKFNSFDKMLKKHLSKEKYNSYSDKVKFLRKTNGIFINASFYITQFWRRK